jgi:hypothetical protein
MTAIAFQPGFFPAPNSTDPGSGNVASGVGYFINGSAFTGTMPTPDTVQSADALAVGNASQWGNGTIVFGSATGTLGNATPAYIASGVLLAGVMGTGYNTNVLGNGTIAIVKGDDYIDNPIILTIGNYAGPSLVGNVSLAILPVGLVGVGNATPTLTLIGNFTQSGGNITVSIPATAAQTGNLSVNLTCNQAAYWYQLYGNTTTGHLHTLAEAWLSVAPPARQV